MQVNPLGKQVLLKAYKRPEPQPGEIIKPETYTEAVSICTVIHAGASTLVKNGELVVIRPHSGDEIDINGEKHLLIDGELILANIK